MALKAVGVGEKATKADYVVMVTTIVGKIISVVVLFFGVVIRVTVGLNCTFIEL